MFAFEQILVLDTEYQKRVSLGAPDFKALSKSKWVFLNMHLNIIALPITLVLQSVNQKQVLDSGVLIT